MVKVERERDTLLCFIHDLKTTLLFFLSPTISFFLFFHNYPFTSTSSSIYWSILLLLDYRGVQSGYRFGFGSVFFGFRYFG